MSRAACKSLPIEELVPHARPMLLIDRVTDASDESFECEVTLNDNSEFCVDGRVGAWVGLEYMAQTVAAFAGAQGLSAGRRSRVGLLLGTRQYVARVPHFQAGVTLRIRATKVLVDSGPLGVVECSLRRHPSGEELASALLTVYQVEDLASYLREQGP